MLLIVNQRRKQDSKNMFIMVNPTTGHKQDSKNMLHNVNQTA